MITIVGIVAVVALVIMMQSENEVIENEALNKPMQSTEPNECKFETAEYAHLNDIQLYWLCESNMDFTYGFVPNEMNSIYYDSSSGGLNSHGFRGPEFTSEKPDGVYRIFLVGGSTIFGAGALPDDTVWSNLQELYNEAGIENVEVINAGINYGWSKLEIGLIENRLINYEPDLLIVYDGWNDAVHGTYSEPEIEWRDNWIETCDSNSAKNIDTIIALQPVLGSSNRTPTDQEFEIWNQRNNSNVRLLDLLALYSKQLPEISQHCNLAVDMRGVFDVVHEPIYWDEGHVGKLGNEIVGNKFFELSLPFVTENHKEILSKMDLGIDLEDNTSEISAKNDFRGKLMHGDDFSGQNLNNALFLFSTLNDVNFSNANLENTDFRFAKLYNVDFNGANLKNAKFPRSYIENSDFTNADLSNSYMIGVGMHGGSLENANLENANFASSDLTYINLKNANLNYVNFKHAIIKHVDYKNTVITNAKFNGALLQNTNFDGRDFSSTSISGTSHQPTLFVSSTLDNAKFNNVDLNNVQVNLVFNGTRLSLPNSLINTDFTGATVTTFIVSLFTDYTDYILEQSYIDENYVNFSNANLSGLDLSNKNLSMILFTGADLSGTNLSGANLSGADLTNANLSGADLTNAKLDCIGNIICN